MYSFSKILFGCWAIANLPKCRWVPLKNVIIKPSKIFYKNIKKEPSWINDRWKRDKSARGWHLHFVQKKLIKDRIFYTTNNKEPMTARDFCRKTFTWVMMIIWWRKKRKCQNGLNKSSINSTKSSKELKLKISNMELYGK